MFFLKIFHVDKFTAKEKYSLNCKISFNHNFMYGKEKCLRNIYFHKYIFKKIKTQNAEVMHKYLFLYFSLEGMRLLRS